MTKKLTMFQTSSHASFLPGTHTQPPACYLPQPCAQNGAIGAATAHPWTPLTKPKRAPTTIKESPYTHTLHPGNGFCLKERNHITKTLPTTHSALRHITGINQIVQTHWARHCSGVLPCLRMKRKSTPSTLDFNGSQRMKSSKSKLYSTKWKTLPFRSSNGSSPFQNSSTG